MSFDPEVAARGVLLLVLLRLALRLWLGARQIRHVARHAVRVPERFAGAVSAGEHERAAQYTQARERLALVDALAEAALFLVLTFGGALQWLAAQCAALAGTGMAGALLLAASFAVLVTLVEIPLDWVRQFRIEQRFGFNRMGPGMFLADLARSALLGAALGLPLLWLVLVLMERAGPWWWVWAWVAWALFSVGLAAAWPRFIAPLFNRFTPLGEGELRGRIGALLERTGFRSDGVFTMDGSRRSTHGNAYFTGLGAGKRVVFFDTLLERLDAGEIEAVLAHELGHFRLRHIARGIALQLALALAWLAALGWLGARPELFAALGLEAPPAGALRNAIALLLFALATPLPAFLLSPLRSALSRRQEFEADAFAAGHARAADLASALVKLHRDNAGTLTPDPLHSAFYDSHPPASIRVERLLALVPRHAAS